MASLAELLVKIGVDAKEFIKGTDDATNRVSETMQALEGPALVAGGLAAGALAVGFDSALDLSSATARMEAQLGLTEAEAARAGDIAGDVFRDGFGNSMDEAAGAVSAFHSSIGELGDFTDSEVRSMSSSALALADVFGIDVAESMQAAGQMIKNGLASDGQEAFDMLTAGAQQLPARMQGELPEIVSEYGANFAQLGLSGEQMFGMISAAAEEGGWSIDQAADAVRELGIRVMNNEAPDALEALGFNAEEMARKFSAGGEEAAGATEELWSALVGLEDPLEQQQLGAQLFGSMWEDSGAQAILAMDPTAASMGDVAGAAEEMNATLADSPAQQMESAFRTIAGTLGDLLLPVLTSVADFASEHPTLFKIIAVAVIVAAVAFGVLAAALWVVNAAVYANPITWIIIAIIAGIVLLIAAITLIIVYWDEIVAATVAAWEWIKEALATAWEWIKSTAAAVWGAIAGFFTGLWDSIVSIAQAVWDKIVGFFQAGMARGQALVAVGVAVVLAHIAFLKSIPERIRNFFTQAASAAREKISTLVSHVKGIPGRIRSAIGNAGNILKQAGKNIIQGLINGVTGMIGKLRGKFSEITGMIPDWKGPMRVDARLLTPTGEAIMGGLDAGIDNGLPGLRKTLRGVTNEIPRNVNASVRHTGGTGQTITLDVTGTDQEMVRLVRKMVKDRGGNVQVALGTGR